VFAAGLALRRAEDTPIARAASPRPTNEVALPIDEASRNAVATDPLQAGPYLKRAILGFNEQMERIVEVAVVLIVGAMLAFISVPDAAYWFVPVLLMIRPICVWVCIAGSTTTLQQRVLMAWFGIRGIGSVYYLMYAINHGLDAGLAEPFIAITLTVVATSIVIHGVSVTPLMQRYARLGNLQRVPPRLMGRDSLSDSGNPGARPRP
jgi:sodium/hydrogen antiporter